MKKTHFEPMEAINIADKMVSDYANLERNLRELRTILAVICLQQHDKCLTVPFSALKELPAGVELEVSVDRVNSAFQFSLIGADGIYLSDLDPALGEDIIDNSTLTESTGLASDDHVAGGLR